MGDMDLWLIGSVRFMVDDLKGLFQCKQFNDSVVLWVVIQYLTEEETNASREPREDVRLLLEASVVRIWHPVPARTGLKLASARRGTARTPGLLDIASHHVQGELRVEGGWHKGKIRLGIICLTSIACCYCFFSYFIAVLLNRSYPVILTFLCFHFFSSSCHRGRWREVSKWHVVIEFGNAIPNHNTWHV